MSLIFSVKTVVVAATLLLSNFTLTSCEIPPVPQAGDQRVTVENGERGVAAQSGSAGNLSFTAIDFCYVGSVSDPATGETVDLYARCPEDGFEQNINIA